jgi:hypothetical protein
MPTGIAYLLCQYTSDTFTSHPSSLFQSSPSQFHGKLKSIFSSFAISATWTEPQVLDLVLILSFTVILCTIHPHVIRCCCLTDNLFQCCYIGRKLNMNMFSFLQHFKSSSVTTLFFISPHLMSFHFIVFFISLFYVRHLLQPIHEHDNFVVSSHHHKQWQISNNVHGEFDTSRRVSTD